MASEKDSEVQKSEDLIQEVNIGDLVNVEDPVKEVILAVMKIVLWEEERALLSDINEYCNNLSRQLLNRLSELEAQPCLFYYCEKKNRDFKYNVSFVPKKFCVCFFFQH